MGNYSISPNSLSLYAKLSGESMQRKFERLKSFKSDNASLEEVTIVNGFHQVSV